MHKLTCNSSPKKYEYANIVFTSVILIHLIIAERRFCLIIFQIQTEAEENVFFWAFNFFLSRNFR